jgi:ubiquinone/menaquinone biosynthesis C-methylase UbiE
MSPIDPETMFPPRPTALAQGILKRVIRAGDLVIDATAGNGHDTLFLANCVGGEGKVLAFDVQEAAIAATRVRVIDAGFEDRVQLIQSSHEHLADHASEKSVAAVMFNLGYLPGDDHKITTQASGTLAALDAAVRVIRTGGVLSVVCYPGHPAGATEAKDVERWMTDCAAKGWRVAKYGAVGTRRPAPFLLIAAAL